MDSQTVYTVRAVKKGFLIRKASKVHIHYLIRKYACTQTLLISEFARILIMLVQCKHFAWIISIASRNGS